MDAILLSIALERVTIECFMLARVVAAAIVPRSAAYLLEHLLWDGDLRHFDIASAAHRHSVGANHITPIYIW